MKASNALKLGGPDKDLLKLDLAKEQLRDPSNESYVPLFLSKSALHHIGEHTSGKWTICEVDTAKMKEVKMYKTSDIISSMGAVASPVPDYLGRGEIPKEAVKRRF